MSDEDIVHAYHHPIRVFEVGDLVMLIGSVVAAGRVLEIGVATAEGIDFVVHAMAARSGFLR